MSFHQISKQLILVSLFLVAASIIASAQVPTPTPTPALEQPRPIIDPVRARGRAVQDVIVERAVESYTSAPLRSLTPLPSEPEARAQEVQSEPRFDPQRARSKRREDPDRTVQVSAGPEVAIEIGANFDGIPTGGRPPDPTGAVGASQYVQAVNSSFAVFDKRSGTTLYGPAAINTLWTGINSPCARHNSGDPIVVYDRIAKRWVISQFLLNEQFGECIAISSTDDATGTYHLYRFSYPNFPDYPKFGVWPDAYYVSYNMFGGPTGGRACALEREKMLSGASDARQVCFQTALYNLLPSDFDGTLLPPTGSPNFFLRRSGDGRSIALRRFHVDWTNPDNSSFGVGGSHDPDAVIQVEPFNDSCNEEPRTACIPQPNGQVLESLGERLMFRVAYRRFPDREVLIANHTIEPAGNPSRGAIRWYEVRNPNGTPLLFQQGTFLPDTRSRWMGSAAMDGAGNIAIGYSVSGPATPPGIRIAARAAGDPPGLLGTETVIVSGQAQAGLQRWGDYSQLTIDPSDDCTFWFTAEYVTEISGVVRRVARIASFKVNNCSANRAPR